MSGAAEDILGDSSLDGGGTDHLLAEAGTKPAAKKKGGRLRKKADTRKRDIPDSGFDDLDDEDGGGGGGDGDGDGDGLDDDQRLFDSDRDAGGGAGDLKAGKEATASANIGASVMPSVLGRESTDEYDSYAWHHGWRLSWCRVCHQKELRVNSREALYAGLCDACLDGLTGANTSRRSYVCRRKRWAQWDYYFEDLCYDCQRYCDECPRRMRVWNKWAEDRKATFVLMKDKVQRYDIDRLWRGEEERRTFKLLPSAKDLHGDYDVIYLGWELNEGTTNIVQKRTAQGSLRLSLDEDPGHVGGIMEGIDHTENNDYDHLVGDIKIQNKGHVSIWGLPTNQRISFRFCGYVEFAEDSDDDDDPRCITATAYDDVGKMVNSPIQSNGDSTVDSTVDLRVIQEQTLLYWIPNDHCNDNDLYTIKMRHEINRRARAAESKDWGESWLCHHLSLPENVCKLINDFIVFRPDPHFVLEEDDLCLRLEFIEGYERGVNYHLEMIVIARRKI